MLQIGIHDADDRSIGMCPCVKHCTGKTSQSLANQEANARISPGECLDYFVSPIAAVVVYYKNPPIDFEPIEHRAQTFQQSRQILCFTERRNRQSDLQAFART